MSAPPVRVHDCRSGTNAIRQDKAGSLPEARVQDGIHVAFRQDGVRPDFSTFFD
jgi:hypothetical protein